MINSNITLQFFFNKVLNKLKKFKRATKKKKK